MSVERTFSIVKPDAVAAGQTGEILAMIQKAGFKILALRLTRLTDAQARGCTTASLQATGMAERVYAAIGFRDLGRFLEFQPS